MKPVTAEEIAEALAESSNVCPKSCGVIARMARQIESLEERNVDLADENREYETALENKGRNMLTGFNENDYSGGNIQASDSVADLLTHPLDDRHSTWTWLHKSNR